MTTMRESQTAVLERGHELTGELCTEPFEVAWADQARWFVQTLIPAAEPTELTVAVQVSPDGLTWVDHEAAAVSGPQTAMLTGAVDHLGHWLRLRVVGEAPRVRIHLALKA